MVSVWSRCGLSLLLAACWRGPDVCEAEGERISACAEPLAERGCAGVPPGGMHDLCVEGFVAGTEPAVWGPPAARCSERIEQACATGDRLELQPCVDCTGELSCEEYMDPAHDRCAEVCHDARLDLGEGCRTAVVEGLATWAAEYAAARGEVTCGVFGQRYDAESGACVW